MIGTECWNLGLLAVPHLQRRQKGKILASHLGKRELQCGKLLKMVFKSSLADINLLMSTISEKYSKGNSQA